ncbi:MAG: DUF6265 family protein [Gemmatimonadaceae bacterium]
MSRTSIVTAVGVAILSGSPSFLSAQAHSTGDVQWLTGCWERASAARRTVERWHPPVSGAMRGESRTFAGGAETAGERLRIYLSDGTLVYAAHPSMQALTEFRATTVTPAELVFENPAHDFPQRIVYSRRGADSLVARIEGDRAGRRQPISFAFRRIDCAGFGDAPATVAEDALRPFYGDLRDRMLQNPAALSAWFVSHADSTLTYVNWTGAGYLARTSNYQTLQRAAQASANTNASALTDYTVDVTIRNILVRGDTVEALVLTTQSAKVVDAAGRFVAAGASYTRQATQRRVDRWVHRDGGWRLAATSFVGDDILIDGQSMPR